MDDTTPFGEPDPRFTTQDVDDPDKVPGFPDITRMAVSPGSEKYVFDFQVPGDGPSTSQARKSISRFLTFNEILKDRDLLADYGIEFKRWMISKKEPNNTKRKITHVAMNFGSFSIEPDEEPLFLERYAIGLASGRDFYMVERPSSVFRLFFDLDFKNLGPLTGAGVEAVAMVTGAAVRKFFPNRDPEDPSQNCRMVVCCTDVQKTTIDGPSGKVSVFKTGIHLHWPNLFVSGIQALTIRETVLADLAGTFGPRVPPHQNAWEDVIDDSVYVKPDAGGSGLRMYGSKKADKCGVCQGKRSPDGSWCKNRCKGGRVDAGRPYALFLCTNGYHQRCPAQEAKYLKNLLQLIQDVSIRCVTKKLEDVEGCVATTGAGPKEPSEGFVVPLGAPMYIPPHIKQKAHKGLSVGATGEKKSFHVNPGPHFEILQQVIRDAFPDKYPEVVVTNVKQQARDKAYLVNISGPNSHYCQNIGREHKSNRIFFVVSIDGIVQRCYDPSDVRSEEMRFDLCKNYASSVGPIGTHARNMLWPKTPDDNATVTINTRATDFLKAARDVDESYVKKLKSLLSYGDFLCNKLYGTTWSVTLTFDNEQKVFGGSARTGYQTVGPADLGLKARNALRDLGFHLEDPLLTEGPQKTVRFEVSLAELEERVWSAFKDWIDHVAGLDEAGLERYMHGPAEPPTKKRASKLIEL